MAFCLSFPKWCNTYTLAEKIKALKNQTFSAHFISIFMVFWITKKSHVGKLMMMVIFDCHYKNDNLWINIRETHIKPYLRTGVMIRKSKLKWKVTIYKVVLYNCLLTCHTIVKSWSEWIEMCLSNLSDLIIMKQLKNHICPFVYLLVSPSVIEQNLMITRKQGKQA